MRVAAPEADLIDGPFDLSISQHIPQLQLRTD